jgi:signal transduction histidine kinase
MDLKWLLVRRITLVALACLLAGSALAIYLTAREAQRHNVELADTVGRQLDLQLSRIGRSTDVPARFPDWDLVAGMSLRPGQCIEMRGVDGAIKRSSCAGVDAGASIAPRWFVGAYQLLLGGELSASRAIIHRGTSQGTVFVAYDPADIASRAWASILPLLGFSAIFVAALCVVTYFVIDRALRPARDVLVGLNRLARGDLTYRLPAFRLAELNRISEVFNGLSADLYNATAERTELARRLVDTQEEERRHIARELHDEIAQKLAALNALAAVLRTRAQREAPDLAPDAKELERTTSALMLTVRRTLTYLRPQEIDDLGLVQSLRALVAEHNENARGATRYSIEIDGAMDQLRAETSAHVYRIVQEALTNASKHAKARNVTVLLSRNAASGNETITLSVVDDGPGVAAGEKSSPPAGSGMIGMRERVVALSGKFDAGPLASGGFRLQVEFPTHQQGVA